MSSAEQAEEQEMEVEALLSILMDDMVMVDGSEGIQGATAACYQITGARTTAHTHLTKPH